ncbi:uncharacterized protein HD556DRAFT_1496924 [Suillus plorans]|uniref:Uncharacterized protein n=1 Tax=Suillus plorans TaxID=116603 RepID=A0A9P7AFT7_9AGAM|nr:uncharacterized protein HD556DRAFT_1496924 [Suillus plorans]KAG1788569.1 hypothetical protein HD556DRAFT_1496924 [Suillus plorans]
MVPNEPTSGYWSEHIAEYLARAIIIYLTSETGVTVIFESLSFLNGRTLASPSKMTLEGGPLSWIMSGKVDAVLDIKFPRDAEDEFALNAILGELAYAIITAATASLPVEKMPGQRELAQPLLTAPTTDNESEANEDCEYLSGVFAIPLKLT